MLQKKTELDKNSKEMEARIEALANIGQDTENRLKSIQELLEYRWLPKTRNGL